MACSAITLKEGILGTRLDFRAGVYFVIFLPLVLSGFVDVDSSLAKIKSALTVLSYVLITVVFLTSKTRHIDFASALYVILILDLGFSTLLFQGVDLTFLSYIAPMAAVIALWVSVERSHLDSILSALNALAVVLIYANALSLVVFPLGMYTTPATSSDISSFLGHNNAVARTTVPLLLFSIAHSYRCRKRISWNITIRALTVFATALYTGSGSGVVGIVPIILLIAFWPRLKRRDINSYILFAGSLGLWAVLICAQFGILEYVITHIFQKDVTLTGRTLIWARAIDYISLSPLFGYGYSNNYALDNGFLLSSTGQSAHNYYLDLLLRGGMPQLIFQMSIVAFTMRSIERKIRPCSNALANIFSVGLLSYFVMWLVEPFVGSGMVLMCSFFIYICRCSDDGESVSSSLKGLMGV